MASTDEQYREDVALPGFRFYPTEEELISFYLDKKLQENTTAAAAGTTHLFNNIIPVADIYSNEPWDLPKLCGESCNGDTEQWFFFVAQQARESRGGRPNRTTSSGYWKATGSTCYVYSSTKKKAIGVKKTMVFYKGKAPTGRKTQWKMNEYKAIKQEDIVDDHNYNSTNVNNNNDIAAASSSGSQPNLSIMPNSVPKLRHEMSVCRVYVTSRNSRAFDRRPSSSLAAAFQAAAAPAAGSPTHDLQAAAVRSSSTSQSQSHDQQQTTNAVAWTVSYKSSSSSSDSSEDPGEQNRSSAVNDQEQHISNTTFDQLDNDMITTSTGYDSLWDWPGHFKWADD